MAWPHLGTFARTGLRMYPLGGGPGLLHVDAVVWIMAAAKKRSTQNDGPAAKYQTTLDNTFSFHNILSPLLEWIVQIGRGVAPRLDERQRLDVAVEEQIGG